MGVFGHQGTANRYWMLPHVCSIKVRLDILAPCSFILLITDDGNEWVWFKSLIHDLRRGRSNSRKASRVSVVARTHAAIWHITLTSLNSLFSFLFVPKDVIEKIWRNKNLYIIFEWFYEYLDNLRSNPRRLNSTLLLRFEQVDDRNEISWKSWITIHF